MVRAGASLRTAARHSKVSVRTAWKWVRRAGGARLDRVDWEDRPPGPKTGARRTPAQVEELVLRTRARLLASSALGESGAAAIRREMLRDGAAAPSTRTIGRILKRRGAVVRKKRVRRPPPPRGWYLPDVASRQAELDGFDVITDLSTRQDKRIEVFTGRSLHGRLPMATVHVGVTAQSAVADLISRWRTHGLPRYAQFDNDTRFTGPNFDPDTVGRVIRLCLSLDVVPVFAAPREHGFQNFVEGFNARWKKVIRETRRPTSLSTTAAASELFVEASREEHGQADGPERRPFPQDWALDLQADLRGRIVFIRRADDLGRVRVLLRLYETVSEHAHRLVRCELDYDRSELRCIALHRSRPLDQPLLRTHPYRPPARTRFNE